MSILLALLALIIIAVTVIALQNWSLVKKSNTPGPAFPYVLLSKSGLFVAISDWVIQNKITKGFVHFWLGPKLAFTAVDPDAAKFFLKTQDAEKSTQFQTSKYISQNFGQNLVNVNGDVWRKQRAVVNYAFQTKAYETYYPIFVNMTEKALKIMSERSAGGKDFDVNALMHRFTLDVLGNSIFNYDFGSMDGTFDEHYQSYTFLVSRLGSVLARVVPFLESLPLQQVKHLRFSVDKMRTFFDRLIDEHRKNKSTEGDMLDHLLQAADTPVTGLSMTELYSNVWIFFVAGHETTASSLTCALYELGQNPDIQQKVYDEVTSVLNDKEPTLKQLHELHYLNQFIQENLRIHPPVHVIPNRVFLKDIHYGDQILPKGTLGGVNIGAIHMHPEHWPNPQKFDPDRFSPENKKGRHNFAFLPFSLGPRMCIGNEFSLIEQRLFLAKLVQKFTVLPAKGKPTWSRLDDAVGLGIDLKDVEIRLVART